MVAGDGSSPVTTPPSPALPAATVVVVRPAPTGAVGAFEVLFLCRHTSMGFMGGAYVFPGGKLDRVDCDPGAQAAIPADVRVRAAAALEPTPGAALSAEQSVGLHVAACRELLEEAGVLLAAPAPGAAAVAELQRALVDRPKDFLPVLAERGLRPAIEALRYVAHWITPSAEPHRFDTRFFVAELPADQEARCDLRESSELVWLAPAAALDRQRRGEIVLPPPTLRTVEALFRPGALEPAVGERPPAVVQPKMVSEGDTWCVLLPWDPEYARAPGEGWPLDAPTRFVAGPSRIALDGGVWRSRAAPG